MANTVVRPPDSEWAAKPFQILQQTTGGYVVRDPRKRLGQQVVASARTERDAIKAAKELAEKEKL